MRKRNWFRHEELLALGVFGPKSRLGDRIEMLLKRGREFSPRASMGRVVASAVVLLMFLIAGSLAPRWIAFAQQEPRPTFEVASIKPSNGTFRSPNFPLDAGDAYAHTGGRFSADFPLITYITFAYKISPTREQRESMLAHVPKWVATERFDIQARAEGNPTKDQMRLMMQSLLADRFKLAVHFETHRVPVLALTLAKPGKLGPRLRPHSEGPPCDAPPTNPSQSSAAGRGILFLDRCDVYELIRKSDTVMAGSRDTTMALLAGAIPSFGRLGRPVVDRTGLAGKFDFMIEWIPEPNGPSGTPNGNVQSDAQGPTFLEALHEQLGLKLQSTKASIRSLVIDHAEKPDAN